MSPQAFDPALLVSTDDLRRQAAQARLHKCLPSLCEFVRHDLAYREAVGDVAPGVLAADEIVDAVVLAAYRHLLSDMGEQQLVATLRKLAVQHIVGEVDHVRANLDTVPVQGDVPEVSPQEQVTMLDERVLYFFEPEGELTAADNPTDPRVPAPDAGPETAELHRCLERAFKGMPLGWRRAMFSRHIDGLSGEALARAVGRSVEEVERMIDHARAYLREQLLEARGNGNRTRGGTSESSARSAARRSRDRLRFGTAARRQSYGQHE